MDFFRISLEYFLLITKTHVPLLDNCWYLCDLDFNNLCWWVCRDWTSNQWKSLWQSIHDAWTKSVSEGKSNWTDAFPYLREWLASRPSTTRSRTSTKTGVGVHAHPEPPLRVGLLCLWTFQICSQRNRYSLCWPWYVGHAEGGASKT